MGVGENSFDVTKPNSSEKDIRDALQKAELSVDRFFKINPNDHESVSESWKGACIDVTSSRRSILGTPHDELFEKMVSEIVERDYAQAGSRSKVRGKHTWPLNGMGLMDEFLYNTYETKKEVMEQAKSVLDLIRKATQNT